ncbi:MAG: FAD-dependent monooxygenase [Myxococcota bacterium]|nr:FAD-dependent monooxygenase [Myxococcota bacterium]
MSEAPRDAQVLIIGAGPVGMTLALDLASRGIDAMIIEQRAPSDPADAKCNTTAARTMEVFRRLGLADAVRASGLADDYPTDVSFRTAVTGPEILRLELPSRSERFGPDGRSAPGYLDSHWPTPEPVVRISQLYLDPLLRDTVEKAPRATIRSQTAFERYEDTGDGVTVHCRDLTTDQPLALRGRYLVGCDGGTSPVRKQMGTALLGDAEISRTRSSLIRSKDLKGLMQGRPAWMTWTVSDKGAGVVVAIDGDELWLVHRNLRAGQQDFESLDREQALRDMLGVGEADGFEYEVIAHQDWVGRRLVAGQFRQGNVFIAGDAAHLWIPIAGYGMNAGIADAMNLSWMLAAVLQGWAPEALLEAHERERHPITEQVSRFAMAGAEKLFENTRDRRVPKALGWRGPVGALLRAALGRRIRAVNEAQFACEGLNFGYYYDDSPLVHYDGEVAPAYTMAKATPSTAPGCRMPHFWLDAKTSLYDALGPWFTLVRFDPAVDVSAATDAAAASGVPLDVLDAPAQTGNRAFRHPLVLVRPDQHVAWRGDAIPDAPGPWIDRLRGAAA